jgi:hypothetical protein
LCALGDSPRADRDRLVLVLGFAGAFRESDLVALEVDHLMIHSDRLTVHLPRSKEDQLALGVTTELPRAANPELCAIGALERWLARGGRSPGPLLRRVRGPCIYPGRASVRLISRVVGRAACRAGLPGDGADVIVLDSHGRCVRDCGPCAYEWRLERDDRAIGYTSPRRYLLLAEHRSAWR